MWSAVWMVSAWFLGAAAPARAQEPVDLLLHDGKVFAADQLLSTYSAVAVRDGRIVALGWDELAERYQAARTIDPARTMETEVDLTVLGGRVVYER